ncbi:MAG: hypothetical protein J6T63_03460 [Bacteroidales bacterium]|nr:hypothetical protein [Bacteroidales bacterium]
MKHEDTDEFQIKIDSFKILLEDYANYIKNGSQYLFPRWMVVTGCCNLTNAVQMVRDQFTENGLEEGKDWFLFEDGNPKPNAIYDLLYDHNGRIVVLNQYKKLLKGELSYLFWKHLFESPDPKAHDIYAPRDGKNYYDANMLSPKEKYFAEVNEGKRPNHFKFTGCVVLLTDVSANEFYVKENQVPSNYITSLKNRALLVKFE